MSALSICGATAGRPGARHTIIDPFQDRDFLSIGVRNLQREGLNDFDLVQEGSEFALPRLAASETGSFDLILVDGWHTFDHTLVDCFYATRLLKVGGFLLIDDANHLSVSQVVRELQRYPCYTVHSGVTAKAGPLRWKGRIAKSLMSFAPFSAVVPYLGHRAQTALTTQQSLVALNKRSADNRPWNWYADDVRTD